ncbi:nicotinamide riboside transporter PnuC [Mucilaginibacter limnophilus]|uniref:Nicotinamide riboside transporter PnuC n=1 Tax=Mucilaginibacter limnophilus TaxID=1932778 RepID=A0A437MUG6_9SPHI|nr:nicotinamide riboside transporter PnuC [Mucilaginibacter limnophilus]RVU01322.1 nicotinamide riboside transporter PnuC [Mucilaginibacter limnophilus]
MQDFLKLFIDQVKETGWLQWIATGFGVAEVLLARKNNILLYPAGIISIVLSVYLLVDVKLFAEAALNIYYLVMSVYGWTYWIKKRGEPAVPVSFANKQEWIITLAISIGGWLVLYLLLKHLTPSDVPVWDALVSSTAWAGMWLLARRKVENWLLLNLSNLFAIPLLFHKSLPLFSLLTVFLFVVAVFGYFDWKKKAGLNK